MDGWCVGIATPQVSGTSPESTQKVSFAYQILSNPDLVASGNSAYQISAHEKAPNDRGYSM